MSRHASNWPFMPKPIRENPPSWTDRLFAFGVNFYFGAILGALVGLAVWAFHFCRSDTRDAGLECIAGGALLAGLVVGIARDKSGRPRHKRHRSASDSRPKRPDRAPS